MYSNLERVKRLTITRTYETHSAVGGRDFVEVEQNAQAHNGEERKHGSGEGDGHDIGVRYVQ